MGLHVAALRITAAIASSVAAFSCGHGQHSESRTRVSSGSADASEVILVATERSDRGGRLVGVAVDGRRLTEITDLRGEVILDRSPVVTRDGKWVIFSSNRERAALADTSLWRVSGRGGEPVRITQGEFIDRDPRISADGRWLYFCSNREGSYDLYRATLEAATGTVGAAELVVRSEGHILSPSVSPDGRHVAYMEAATDGTTRLWRVATDGTGQRQALTDGPNDMTPAWGPDGQIAFASRVPGRDDADVYLMPAEGGERTLLADTTITDETGPRWSRNGRFLFAIGMYRSAVDGKPLLGSVIALDREEPMPVWRALHDSATVETRIGLGLFPVAVDAEALHGNRPYKDALKDVLMHEALRNESRRSRDEP